MTHSDRPAGAIRSALETPARLLVTGVRAARARRLTLSVLGLVVVLAAGGGYLMLGTLRIDPLRSQFRVRVELADSGGLLPGQDVTLRGVRVGRVEAVDTVENRVVAVVDIDSGVRISDSGPVRVASLSAAGEQFLDFVPGTDDGPYLGDGSVIPVSRTTEPTSLATMLGDLSPTLAQIDPDKVRSIDHELGVGTAGPDKLAAIADGATLLIATLDGVLPQTVDLLRNSKTVLTTLGDTGPGLRDTTADLAATMRGIAPRAAGFEDLVDRAPGTLTTLDAILAGNSPALVQLLGNLDPVAHTTYTHIPALQEFFFPQQRGGSALDAIASAFHDGGVWALASIYPDASCDYDVPRSAGSVANFPEPYLNVRCANPDRAAPQIRGANNAPRPPGDDTAFAPPGADPKATADPTPKGPYSIPDPLGGPPLPQPFPHN